MDGQTAAHQPTDKELHDAAHRPLVVRPLPAGFSIVASAEVGSQHWRLELAQGEDADTELLGCWQGEGHEPGPDRCGTGLEEVTDMIAHVAEHVATGTPPNYEP